MKTQLRRLLWVVPGILILMGTHHARAQDLSRMTTRDMLQKIRTMNVDQMSQIVRSMDRDTMAYIIQSMDPQTMTQIARSLDPHTMSAIAKRILAEFSRPQPKSAIARLRQANPQPLGGAGVETAAVPPAGTEPQGSSLDAQVPRDGGEDQMDLTGLVVMVHPSNPVNELTRDQIRKIYTGEYTNWNQVGGPDLAIRVMTVGGEQTSGQTKLTSKAIVSPFASGVFLSVADTAGSFGLLPVMQSRQLRFIGGHDAVKTMAVKLDVPSQGTKMTHSDSASTVADFLLAYGR